MHRRAAPSDTRLEIIRSAQHRKANLAKIDVCLIRHRLGAWPANWVRLIGKYYPIDTLAIIVFSKGWYVPKQGFGAIPVIHD
jgi:hypothetical protein